VYIIELMVDFKTIFLEQFDGAIKDGSIKSICDLGSGESKNFISILEKYPELTYVGIEPSRIHADRARSHLSKFKNVSIYNSDGYSCPNGAEALWGNFDLVISLSVLEHVKQIEKFLSNSVSAVKSGGQVVHRWDLGHALYPSSLKEVFQVWLGDNWPSVLPESKFVSGLKPSRVQEILEQNDMKIEAITYHQMPDHKKFVKEFNLNGLENETLVREIVDWEFEASKYIENWEEDKKLRLFPAVALWSRKI